MIGTPLSVSMRLAPVVIVAAVGVVRVTLPPADEDTPLPPTPTAIELVDLSDVCPFVKVLNTLPPPVPPPPAMDWARMPLDPAPATVMSPPWLTVTEPAAAPPPPDPPTETAKDLFVSSDVEGVAAKVVVLPPSPPPPAIDCATRPCEEAFAVLMLPVFVTVTGPEWAPLPPAPPTATERDWAPLLSVSPVAVAAMPPDPPPPPIDWARMPCSPVRSSVLVVPPVVIAAELATVTVLPTLPVPPAPPMDTLSALLSEEVVNAPVMAKPPLPPPPPMDCATTPRLPAPVAEMLPATATETWLLPLPVPPEPPRATLRLVASALEMVPVIA
ncbi:MAG: hypothetical protein AcusKO_47830 [Acuticoccus sp.]